MSEDDGPSPTRDTSFELTDDQAETFARDGFVVVERLIDPALARRALERYEDLFSGRFETGLYPDEWNWRPGVHPADLTRQICNGWKSDREIARVVLRPDIGRACARLGGWRGARLSQDNVLWKPPGGKALGFHQDSSYEQWAVPSEWVSCWIALEDTTASQGTVEYVRGSHRWSRRWGMIEEFHGPDDPHAELLQAAAAHGVEPELVPVEVPAGGGAFHDGWTWHGSGVNRSDAPRRSLVAHCMSSDARFHPETTGYLYSRYKRFGDETMDESFFPITWRQDGYRSPFLEPYLDRRVGWGGGHEVDRRRDAGACQLTTDRSSTGTVSKDSSSRPGLRRAILSGAGAASTGSPVMAVTRSRRPAPPNRDSQRRRLDPRTMTSAPQPLAASAMRSAMVKQLAR